MMIPTIHMNGDRLETLVQGYRDALEALGLAIEKVLETAPNGRNFYPQGDDAIHRAIEEHHERVHKLAEVRSDIEKIIIGMDGGTQP